MKTYAVGIVLTLVASTAHAQKGDRQVSPMMPLARQPDLVAPPPATKPNAVLPPAAKPKVGVLPPIEYDVPFPGKLKVIRGNKFLMSKLCPRTAFPVPLGCSYADLPDKNECVILIAEDNLIFDQGWTPEIVFRHEVGHCNGFGHDHKGARPVTLDTLENKNLVWPNR